MQTLIKNTSAYRLLKTERDENRLSHTYLILMDDARSLREALNFLAKVFFGCEDGFESPQKQRISALIEKESFSDCLFFPKQDKKFTVADADEIKEESALNPVEADKKLFVIGDFAEVGVAQQNKLLKLLEEPPENVYFLLGATTAYPILQTVLSRAKKLEISSFSEGEVLAFLTRNYPQKAQNTEEMKVFAATSSGNVGTARNALEGGYFSELIEDAFSLCLQTKELPVLAKKLGDSKRKKELICFLRLIFRDALFIKTNADPFFLLLRSERERTKKVASRYALNALLFAQEAFTKAEKQLKFNTNFSQCLEVCFESILSKK
jgi:DNA polymerase-3 subunit delta'